MVGTAPDPAKQVAVVLLQSIKSLVEHGLISKQQRSRLKDLLIKKDPALYSCVTAYVSQPGKPRDTFWGELLRLGDPDEDTKEDAVHVANPDDVSVRTDAQERLASAEVRPVNIREQENHNLKTQEEKEAEDFPEGVEVLERQGGMQGNSDEGGQKKEAYQQKTEEENSENDNAKSGSESEDDRDSVDSLENECAGGKNYKQGKQDSQEDTWQQEEEEEEKKKDQEQQKQVPEQEDAHQTNKHTPASREDSDLDIQPLPPAPPLPPPPPSRPARASSSVSTLSSSSSSSSISSLSSTSSSSATLPSSASSTSNSVIRNRYYSKLQTGDGAGAGAQNIQQSSTSSDAGRSVSPDVSEFVLVGTSMQQRSNSPKPKAATPTSNFSVTGMVSGWWSPTKKKQPAAKANEEKQDYSSEEDGFVLA